jgi:hypothetical protein
LMLGLDEPVADHVAEEQEDETGGKAGHSDLL